MYGLPRAGDGMRAGGGAAPPPPGPGHQRLAARESATAMPRAAPKSNPGQMNSDQGLVDSSVIYIYKYEIAISFYINSIYYIVNRQEVSSEHNRKGGSHSYC